MDEIEQTQTGNLQDEPMKLRQAFGKWLMLLVSWIALLVLSAYWNPLSLLAFIAYFVIGIYLNRKVLPRLIHWHPTYNTLESVTSEKLKLFIAWPVAYLLLFMKLGVDKLL